MFLCARRWWIHTSRPPHQNPPTTQPNGVSVIQSQARRAPPASPLASAPRRPRPQQRQQAPPPDPAPRSAAGGTATPTGRMKKPSAEKDSDEYRQRRERNNLAVKKSRMRSKQKAQDTQQRVNELKEENERLEAKIKLLSKELSVLKDLFLEHAHNLADNVQPAGAAPAGASPANGDANNHSQ
ncbi:CCAAT/enhancer-binding protein gamma [Gadus chalcogrammus]|uniref:CCAAT/enhancer-binding protein gamma n=1 Tax=Gadus chalcogrammus TaxID=1042646 RepID=UPI0024C48326|nr:CCAAT/enhancer-binding protein gamma [Gadus chalcogrammus]